MPSRKARISRQSHVEKASTVRKRTTHHMERIGGSGERVEGLLGRDSPPLQFDFTIRCHSCHSLFQQGKLQRSSKRNCQANADSVTPTRILCPCCALTRGQECSCGQTQSTGRGSKQLCLSSPILRSAWQILGVSTTRDMFSADHNHRLPLFWTWRPSPFAEKVNAFA